MRKTERLVRNLVGLPDDQPADDDRLINEVDAYLRLKPERAADIPKMGFDSKQHFLDCLRGDLAAEVEPAQLS